MQEFFQLCNQAGKAFRGVGAPVVHDDERLNKPIRRFTAEYVSRTMLGVTSQTLAISLCFLLERLGLNVTGEFLFFVTYMWFITSMNLVLTHYSCLFNPLCCFFFLLTGEIEDRDVSLDGKMPLEDLCRRAIDVSLHKNLTTNHAVSQASSLSNALQGVYRQKEKAALIMQNADSKNFCLTRLQVLLTAHSWYHEDILQESFTTNLTTLSKFMS